MTPTSHKELIKLTAEQLNLPEDLVKDLITMYYKDRREKLSTLHSMKTPICGIGSFVIRSGSIPYQIERVERTIVGVKKRNDTVNKATIIEELEWKLFRLNHILENCIGTKKAKLKKKKIRIKLDKDERSAKWRAKRLAKQTQDFGGNTQHLVPESVCGENS